MTALYSPCSILSTHPPLSYRFGVTVDTSVMSSGVGDILTKFKSSITGYVLFDPADPDTTSAALT